MVLVLAGELERVLAGQAARFTLVGVAHGGADHERGDEGGDQPHPGDDQQSRHTDVIGRWG
jgi:hypothetical protein